MGYKLYRSEELAHAAKGSSWSNHKYISKFFKNGKWVYVYKGNFGNQSPTQNFQNNNKTTTKEYLKVERNGKVTRYKESTSNGTSWLSKRLEVRNSDGSVNVYKTKGKIAQGVEKAASKGKSFIERIGKKKKKSKKSNIKVTSHTTTLG